ncbi:hypothetical protein [Paenibacillus sp. P46E]|uniref:hypothetical protein n=1 Tax=Paenibacillus sp. P46E TaxID=1349436 RepID=UPI000939ADF7|nr:hypothetical protein [Paenibacillus sp. P46E]OKP99768.1 hypothetical protein A3849_02895 [Paenibacillus sp. P46E]
MSALRTLIGLEYSRYRPARFSKKQRSLTVLVLFPLLLFLGMYLPGFNTSQRSPFITVALLLWTVSMGISFLHMASFPGQRNRDWVLTFPHSRLTLLYAKGACLLRHSLNLTLLLYIEAIVLYCLSTFTGRYTPLPAGELVYTLTAYLMFIFVLLPIAVVFGLLASLIMRPGRVARVLLLPYSILWMLPFILIGLLNSQALGIYDMQYTAPSYIILYTAALLVVGWPACYFLMPRIAVNGLGQMGGRSIPAAASSKAETVRKPKKDRHLSARSQSPFVTLYKLDSSRLQQMEKHQAVRILKLAAPVIAVAMFYFTSGNLNAMQSAIRLPFIFPVLFGSFWMLLRNSFERKQLPWWLGFPQRRLRLLLSGIAAVWVTVMRVNVVLGVSAVVGLLAGLAAGKSSFHEMTQYMFWLFFSFLVYTLALTLALGLLQISYYLMRSRALSLLFLPVAFAVPLQSNLINTYMFPASYGSGWHPDWALLGWTALLGLPFAVCCILAGSKYYHLVLMQKNEGVRTKQA